MGKLKDIALLVVKVGVSVLHSTCVQVNCPNAVYMDNGDPQYPLISFNQCMCSYPFIRSYYSQLKSTDHQN